MIGTTVRKFKCACGLDVSVSLCEHFAIADAEQSASVAQLEAEVARLEAQLVNATEKGLELAKLLDPAVVWAATQLKANADAHPGGCCVKCRAALAEVARLEALIVSTVEAATGIDADLHAEYDRIKAKP